MQGRAGEKDYKGAEEIFRGDEYVHYLDCDDFIGYTYIKTYQIILFKHMHRYGLNCVPPKFIRCSPNP